MKMPSCLHERVSSFTMARVSGRRETNHNNRKEFHMGKIHSLETFGTVDGPGVRFVVFFQGCPMRCAYCHNPDTWQLQDGQEMSADEIIRRLERNRSFYKTGGITATGGEPMLQIELLTELFAKALKWLSSLTKLKNK